MFQCNSYEHSMKNAHMCPHFPYTCASLLQLSLLIVLSWIEFQNNYPHSQKILLMKEIPVQTDSRVDTGNISNICAELYAHRWGEILPALTFQ